MRKYYKLFTSVCIVGLLIAVVAVSSVVRIGVDTVRGMITTVPALVSVTADGVSIADMITVDGSGVSVGGIRVDFEEIGAAVSDTLDAAGVAVESGSAGSMTSDVTEAGFTQNRYAFDAAVNRALDINVAGCDVIIAGGDTDAIVVDVLETENFRYSMTTADQTLVIRDGAVKNNTVRIFGFEFSLGRAEPAYTGLAMIVYLPRDFSGKINLHTSGGDVKIGALALDEELVAVTSDADMELYDVEAYEISASTADGRITLANLSATEIRAVTSGGRISMSELTAKRLSAATSAASIDFTRLFGEKFELTTANGDISGSILGSQSLFSIVTETDRSAFPPTKENTRAQYSLRASTNGGDINVRFVD